MSVKIIRTETDTKGRAVKVFTVHEETGKESEIVLSADFCHYCIDDLASEFAEYMRKAGHPIVQKHE